MLSNRIHGALCAVLALGLAASCGVSANPSGASKRGDIVLPKDADVIESRVPRDATLETLLKRHAVSSDVAAAIVAASKPVFEPRSLRADPPYRVIRSLEGVFRAFEYEIDNGRFLRISARPSAAGGPPALAADVIAYPRNVSIESVDASISRDHSSLIGAFNASGETVELALLVADVFGGQVDFNSDLHVGDRVEALFEKVTRDGAVIGYGEVKAAVLHNGGKAVTAIRYIGPDGKPAWYDEKGQSLKRQFLASPLRLDPSPTVTSSFSYRRVHPIYEDTRAHLGVDYHAAYGAPVIAVASGIVEIAGWNGDAGRMVEIRHAGGYETGYLHLSAFAPGIAPGVRVEQGQLIGRVGDSGAATAPHLHYLVKKNGEHVNPVLEQHKMPAGVPISPEMMSAFTAARDAMLNDLKTRLIAARPH